MTHLYIQTAFLGDLLLSIPTLKHIRYWSPQSQILLVCRKGYGSLMKELGVCDEVIEVDKSNKSEVGKILKDRTFDTIFCPHQSLTSHKIVKSLKATQKVGYKKFWNSSFFTKRVERNLLWPEALRQLQLLGAVYDKVAVNLEAFAQKEESIPKWAEMSLNHFPWTENKLKIMAEDKLPGFKVDRPYVCVAPGSVWPTKRWQSEGFIRVATHFARENFQVLIVGAPDERELCEKVHKQIPNSFSLAGHLDVLQSMMFLWKANLLICNDSGAMHMASVVRCPTIAIFGPTVQELGYKPWNADARVVEDHELLCRPCGQHGSRVCPIRTHACMKNIKPRHVIEAAESVVR